MSSIKKQFKGNIGMFLVCAELSKKNLLTMPTSRNTRGYDIIVLDLETKKSVGLQVKCSDKKEFPVLSTHWNDYEQKIEEKILSDFIFVNISNLDKPCYFILSVKEVKGILKSNVKNYLAWYQQKHNLTLKQMLEKEKKDKRKPDLWIIRLNEIEKYKDEWETITQQLKN